MQITSRGARERCPFCHDALREPLHVCVGCDTACHADCRRAMPRCPTLGCTGVRENELARPRVPWRPIARLGVAFLVELALLVFLLALTGAVFEPLVRFFALGEIGFDMQPSPFAMLVLVPLLVQLVRTGRRAWRLPRETRTIRRLVESEPVAMDLEAPPETDTWGLHGELTSRTGESLHFELGLLAPSWMRESGPVLVRGNGPLLIERDGRFAFVPSASSREVPPLVD